LYWFTDTFILMRKRYLITGLIIGILLSSISLSAQETQVSRVIRWVEDDLKSLSGKKISDTSAVKSLHFNNAVYSYPDTLLPFYFEVVDDPAISAGSKIKIENFIFKPVPANSGLPSEIIESLGDNIEVNAHIAYIKKKPVLSYSLLPLRRNPESGQVEKLVYFTYKISHPDRTSTQNLSGTKSYLQSSVLKTGKWVKLSIREDGIYKLSYSELVSMGLTNPSNPKIFGNGGRMLSMNSAEPRPDDLVENAIMIEMGADEIFNEGDYLLFYGKGPGEWKYHPGEEMFLHTRHLYTDAAYYYLTSDVGIGKSIALEAQSTQSESDRANSRDFTLTGSEVIKFGKRKLK